MRKNRRVKTEVIKWYSAPQYLWGFGYIYESGKLIDSQAFTTANPNWYAAELLGIMR